jgi:hypothetical protein
MEILRHAALSPNGHNTQPWQVQIVHKDKWLIFTDPQRRLPAVDPDNHDNLVSIGAFLESLSQTAEHFGLQCQIDYRCQSKTDLLIAELNLVPTTAKSNRLPLIRSRRTVRTGLLSKELQKAELRSMFGSDQEYSHYLPFNSSPAHYLAEGTREANRLQTYRNPAQEELADWIRWTKREIEQHRDGLTPASMDISGLAGWYVSLFYDRSAVLEPAFRETTMKKVDEQVTQNGGWIVITSQGNGPVDYLESGRRLQRICLNARQHLIAIHPMTQILQEGNWRHSLAGDLGLQHTVHMVLRTGYVNHYPAPVSPRRPINWFTR